MVRRHSAYQGAEGTVIALRGLGRVQVELDSGQSTNIDTRDLQVLR